MRGGVSHSSKKFNKANDKYLKAYDWEQESKHITYLDANNLFSYALSKFLPTSAFKWIDLKEFDLIKYNSNTLKVVFYSLILNILKNYGNYIMINL